MRKTLLASAAILGASGSLALAQSPPPAFAPIPIAPPGAVPNNLQGQYIGPLQGGPGAQNNLNAFGTATAGAAVAPTPGTVVIRLNGKVYAGIDLSYGTGLQSSPSTIAPAVGATPATAVYKLNPIGMDSYLRLYPGIDGMATNGLRYGAGVEIRENFEGGNSFSVSSATATTPASTAITTNLPSGSATSGTNSSASGVSSSQTLFVRRAFVYLGSDQTGIIRIGQQDGLIGIYDATGIFTFGSWDGGIGSILNSGVQAATPNQYLISWAWLSNNGVEYGDNKIVYLSPSFAGVDFGLEYGPNQGNSFSNSATSDPYAVGPCNVASANCINVTSGTDSSRWINRFGVGVRFIEDFAGIHLQGYGDYTVSGHAQNEAAVQAGPTHFATGAGALKYDGQNFFNGGLAATFMGFTVAGDFTHGRLNGSNALDPSGGVPMNAELGTASYAYGPISVGAVIGIVDSQGSAELVNTSQRHEVAFAVGGAYRIAPGLNLCLEYQYLQKHQGDFNFNTNGIGSAASAGSNGTGGAGNIWT
jgi:predicted porin